MITLPCIRVEERAMQRDVLGNQVSTRVPVHVVARLKTLLSRLTRHRTDDRGRSLAQAPCSLH